MGSSKLLSGVSNFRYAPSAGSKSKVADCVDLEFISEVERLESEIKSCNNSGKGDKFVAGEGFSGRKVDSFVSGGSNCGAVMVVAFGKGDDNIP
ncbi:unnamed protein product [Eruca vesicaria subsp. sativa]|uniref:Uncharacterized protein n=1 Tax=Eruca vesicaria subsp. sativa TaxID=29727 RepID=A0ABC8J8K1_ERUVS|nr:unnamed protein product [Eruca vesicaria subsp. sativa]